MPAYIATVLFYTLVCLFDDPQPIVLQDMSNLLFTNALDMDAADDKKYEEPLALWKFRDMAQMAIDEYNSTHKSQLNIVLFEYAN